ncbi:MAG: HlyD family efflux transporter periplasmic adaptor subunit [Dermatophilaceae bacterium]
MRIVRRTSTGPKQVTYKAVSDGRLADVASQEGGFVQNGANLATIIAVGSQYAVADFVLSPRDYERIERGAAVSVRLPNNESVAGTVQSVTVKADAGRP